MTIRFIGVGQSQIDQTMKEHMHLLDDVLETSQFEAGRVDFTFALPSDRPEDRARLEELRKEFHQHLGEFIYADDARTTLEDSVLERLLSGGQTIAVAEVGSGGELAAALCHTELASKVLGGAFVAASEEQLRQLLSVTDALWNGTADSAKLELLATTAAQRANSQWSIVVGAPQQDPQTNTPQVTVCMRHPNGTVFVSSQRWPGMSSSAQAALTSELLDKLRRALR